MNLKLLQKSDNTLHVTNYTWIDYRKGLKYNVNNKISAGFQSHSVINSNIVICMSCRNAYSKQSIDHTSLTGLWLNGTINIYYLLRTSRLFHSWWVDVYPRKLWWIFYYCSVISCEGKAIRLTPGVGFLLAPGPKRTKGVVFFIPVAGVLSGDGW